MNKTIEKLWNEYFADECAKFETDEERELAKKALENHETLNRLLTGEQSKGVEKYIDALCDTQSFFMKKAFLKGCEFAVSFFLEAGNF